jgi:hypothetical protein
MAWCLVKDRGVFLNWNLRHQNKTKTEIKLSDNYPPCDSWSLLPSNSRRDCVCYLSITESVISISRHITIRLSWDTDKMHVPRCFRNKVLIHYIIEEYRLQLFG